MGERVSTAGGRRARGLTRTSPSTKFDDVRTEILSSGTASVNGRGSDPSSNEFYRRVVEGMRCGIITLDANGRVLTCNELARDILELDESTRDGGAVETVLAGHPRLAEVLRSSLEMSHLPNRAELELRTRGDDGRTIGFTISPIVGDAGPQGVAIFFKDLTQVERREEQERLRDRLAALGQMAASMAHEIRNPLASIEVTATLLKRRLRDKEDETTRLVAKIIDEIARLNRTVTQGLEFARAISPERVEQSVVPILDQAVANAGDRFPGHRVRIEMKVSEDAPRVPVDANFLEQVFVNLVVNAIEALELLGHILISVAPYGGDGERASGVEIRVEDDGPGIPGEIREKLFYPFVTTKRNGSGIGLAMARKIVECHNGLIDVASTPGSGTTFRIRLPRALDVRGEN